MALIKCPECGKEVSDTCDVCIHCGYRLKPVNPDAVTYKVVDDDDLTLADLNGGSTQVRSGYDVMLVDYRDPYAITAQRLQNSLACSLSEARSILDSLPAYLYTDVDQESALYIARTLQSGGMRVALYDPEGRCTYYAPQNYSRPVPNTTSAIRNPFFSIIPEIILLNALMPRRTYYNARPQYNPFFGGNFFSPFRMNINTPRRQSAPRNSVPNFGGRSPGSSRGPKR